MPRKTRREQSISHPSPHAGTTRALLYTRVSTDDQAQGYSLRDQEMRLREYCLRRQIQIAGHFQDDHSAKTFDRPEWTKMLRYLEANPYTVQQVLVVKWDRFSRDQTGAFMMIDRLEKLGVQMQAAEQHIDWHVPEQRMLLAIYIAAPEIENLRRSMNTIMGTRRAMREGRWCNGQPIGYRKGRDDRDKPLMQLSEKAPLVREAFELVARRTDLSVEEVRRRLYGKGLAVSRSRFIDLLKNPVYMGKILIPAWRDEPETIVEALHKPIVDEALFYQVQERFTKPDRGKKKSKLVPELVMRGHLLCPACGELLTGSRSKGHGGTYAYYHCHHCRQTRFRAEEAHQAFAAYLSEQQISPRVAALYELILKDLYREEEQGRVQRLVVARREVTVLEEKLFLADEKYLEGDLEADSYQRLKGRYGAELVTARVKLAELESMSANLADQIAFAVDLLSDLGRIYQNATPDGKQAYLVRTHPKKLVYEKGSFRTSPESDIMALLRGKPQKIGTPGQEFDQASCSVAGTGRFSNLFGLSEEMRGRLSQVYELRHLLAA